jgi:hypothetical protein
MYHITMRTSAEGERGLPVAASFLRLLREDGRFMLEPATREFWEQFGDDKGTGLSSGHDHLREPGTVRWFLSSVVRRNQRSIRPMTKVDWADFNEFVNDYLDGVGRIMLKAGHPFSAEVKASSYVVRLRDMRRETFVPGDYHGIKSQWSPAVCHGL